MILVSIAEGNLPLQQRFGIRLWQGGRWRQIIKMHEVFLEPEAIRALGRELTLDLFIGDDAALLGIDEEHPARLQAAFLGDLIRRHIEHTDLRSHDDAVILRHIIARRAEAVAIKYGANLLAIGESNGGRAIPWLHQAGVILIEGLPCIVHALMVGPRFGDHHHHRVWKRAAGEHEHFERVVEHGRVAAIGIDDRVHLPHVVAEQVRLEERAAGMHPVDVTAQCVDLSIMRHVAIRMGAFPTRKGVGTETRMDEREGGFHRRIPQIGEIFRQLLGQEHAFVDDCLVGQTGQIPVFPAIEAGGANLVVGPLPDYVELPFECQVIDQLLAPADENLPDERFARTGGVT